jgi:hypothetical protein
MIDISHYATRDDLFRALKENKRQLVARKQSRMKCADAVFFHAAHEVDATKSVDVQQLLTKDTLTVRSVINTAGLLDSHGDVHIKGLWKKSLQEQTHPYLLQEHKNSFDHIISDRVKASAVEMTWKELGFDFDGKTEALVFESEIDKGRNPYMFEQYARGYVKNHSVGMCYVQLFMCLNSDKKYFIEEKENWDRYIDEVINRESAEEHGYFWAVTEAKFIEGSAVPIGSNPATPTQSVKELSGEPPTGDLRYIEPPKGAQNSMFQKFINLK